MNSRDALIYTTRELSSHNISYGQIEARTILCHTLNQSASDLFSNPEYILNDAQIEHLSNLINRISLKEPLSYVLNQCEFYGLDFYVDQDVLIPRPETELLVEEAIRFCRELTNAGNSSHRITLADIGTGCGVIAVCLSKYMDNIKVYATDISAAALDIAKRNCNHHVVSDRIRFLHGNLLDFDIESLNLIVANLPYVSSEDINSPLNQLIYEPRIALDGGKDGLEIIERLLTACKSKLARNAGILLEIGYDQDKKIESLVNRLFINSKLTFIKDYSAHNRVVKIVI